MNDDVISVESPSTTAWEFSSAIVPTPKKHDNCNTRCAKPAYIGDKQPCIGKLFIGDVTFLL